MSSENITGPTVAWQELKGEKVRTNDDKDLGRIKNVSIYHLRIEKGSLKKRSFWIPKNLVDVFDGKHLWLKSNESELHQKYYYGEDPPGTDGSGSPLNKENVRIVNERMAGVPTEQADPNKEYKNIRDNQ
jgi:hypothetical protein